MGINTEKAFDAEAIRNTADHTSKEIFNGNFVVKTLIIENSLNQDVVLQCQGSAEASFDNPFDIGAEWTATANTNSYQTCDSYIPYWRIVAACAVAPTTGSLTVFVIGVD